MQLVAQVIVLDEFDLDHIFLMMVLLGTMALAEDNFKFIIIVKDDIIYFKGPISSRSPPRRLQ